MLPDTGRIAIAPRGQRASAIFEQLGMIRQREGATEGAQRLFRLLDQRVLLDNDRLVVAGDVARQQARRDQQVIPQCVEARPGAIHPGIQDR